MTTEEKAKAYDEAIERAKNFIENGDEREGTIAESIFAGLMEESEDEKIRKELITEVKEQIDCIPAPDCRNKEDEKALKQLNKWLAWLEKQGEQIPTNSAKTCKDEQTPAAWSKDDEANLQKAIECCVHVNFKFDTLEEQLSLLGWLKNLKERIIPQPKQEWSEELLPKAQKGE